MGSRWKNGPTGDTTSLKIAVKSKNWVDWNTPVKFETKGMKVEIIHDHSDESADIYNT